MRLCILGFDDSVLQSPECATLSLQHRLQGTQGALFMLSEPVQTSLEYWQQQQRRLQQVISNPWMENVPVVILVPPEILSLVHLSITETCLTHCQAHSMFDPCKYSSLLLVQNIQPLPAGTPSDSLYQGNVGNILIFARPYAF